MAAPHLARTGPPAGPDASWEAAGPARPDEADRRAVRSWPLLLLALPAAVAVWSGWVGIGQLTGFGEVRPLPGIWDSLHLDSAITLPVGVDAYAAYALHAWLASSADLGRRTRRFAKWSAIGSLLLGMAGQVAYHLLTQAGARHAPWGITVAVACLPVLILGMAAGLTHLIRADTTAGTVRLTGTEPAGEHADPAATIEPARLAQAQAAASQLAIAGQRVSRRNLRAAGMHGSNTELSRLSRIITARPDDSPLRAPGRT